MSNTITRTPSAAAHVTAKSTPDEPIRFEESYGWEGKTRTFEVSSTSVHWSIDLTADTPKWRADSVRTMCRWVRKDGTLGAATHTLYGYSRNTNGDAIRAYEDAVVKATRPTIIPTLNTLEF